MNADDRRYSRQILFQPIGEEGQARLRASSVLLCGCGALGTVIAETLTRAGIGKLRIVDRDFVDLSNLQRQVLFDEQDVEDRLPKVIAASQKLARINRQVALEPIVADIDHTNILEFTRGVDLILDGTDNFEVRFLINDASLETGIPWIYAGCLGSHGQFMTIFPGKSACLRCLMDQVPEPGTTETCDTAGILGPTVSILASFQCVEALKILTGHADQIEPMLTIIDIWQATFRRMSIADLRDRADCPACKHGERLWLSGRAGSQTTVLCGRNAVQVSPPERLTLNLDQLAERLATAGDVKSNPFLVRFRIANSETELTIFRDGRAIVQGTDDAAVAKGLYARYVGN